MKFVARCDQTTQRGERCERPATWEAPDRRSGEIERYCTQHANYHVIPRKRGAVRITNRSS